MRTSKLEKTINISIFDSGDGVCTAPIIEYFEPFVDAQVSCVITNNSDGFVKLKCKLRRYRIPIYQFQQYEDIEQYLTKHDIHYIVLSGYNDRLPGDFCKKYKNKIINIYPLLLSSKHSNIPLLHENLIYETIRNSHENKIGITIHLVDEEYFNKIIFQKDLTITNEEKFDVDFIKSTLNQLMINYYPKIIEKFIKGTYKHLYDE